MDRRGLEALLRNSDAHGGVSRQARCGCRRPYPLHVLHRYGHGLRSAAPHHSASCGACAGACGALCPAGERGTGRPGGRRPGGRGTGGADAQPRLLLLRNGHGGGHDCGRLYRGGGADRLLCHPPWAPHSADRGADPRPAGRSQRRRCGVTRRRFCAVQAFSLKAKTLAQGEFTSPEQLKKTGGAALRAAEPKQKDTLFSVSFCLEQVRRIELPYSAWEADVLPLNYTCIG